MATESRQIDVHVCACSACKEHPRSAVAREHRVMNQLLSLADERLRRLLAGLFATQRGRGGVRQVARITGLDRNTIAKGRKELAQDQFVSGRLRKRGAGRKRVEQTHPGS